MILRLTWCRCELVSDCIFVHWLHNFLYKGPDEIQVVNWYQIVFSFIDYTTCYVDRIEMTQLWIGIRLYFRSLTTQQLRQVGQERMSCELVSDCIFVHWLHNAPVFAFPGAVVVNWYQIVFSFIDYTTDADDYFICSGCELVSDCIFVHWLHNQIYVAVPKFTVVNWYQIVFSFIDYTTNHFYEKTNSCCELVSDCIFVHWLHNS